MWIKVQAGLPIQLLIQDKLWHQFNLQSKHISIRVLGHIIHFHPHVSNIPAHWHFINLIITDKVFLNLAFTWTSVPVYQVAIITLQLKPDTITTQLLTLTRLVGRVISHVTNGKVDLLTNVCRWLNVICLVALARMGCLFRWDKYFSCLANDIAGNSSLYIQSWSSNNSCIQSRMSSKKLLLNLIKSSDIHLN